MRNYTKIILALLILAGLVLVARWLLISPTSETAKAAAAPMPSAYAAAMPGKLATVTAPKAAPAPAGDKNELSAKASTPLDESASTQIVHHANYETDFGVIELEDGVAKRLTLDSGGTCEIRPTVLSDGSLKLVVIFANPDPDTGEMVISSPSIVTQPGQPVWLGMGGNDTLTRTSVVVGDGTGNSSAKFGVSFTPKLKNK